MALIKSKQISDFREVVDWAGATSTDIPNSWDVKEEFIVKEQMVSEIFYNNTISSANQTWSLALSDYVYADDIDNVNVFVNVIKTDNVISITSGATGSIITMGPYGYDIEPEDLIKVRYMRTNF